jgi:gluconolactonase
MVNSSVQRVLSRKTVLFVMLAGASVFSCAGEKQPVVEQKPVPYAESPVVEAGAEIKLITGGHGFTEGPVVDASGNLFFVDIPFNTIFKVTPDGACTPFVSGSGSANGLGISPDGVLYACLNGDRSVVAVDSTGKYTTVCDKYKGKLLNNPNDMWFDAKGGFYFTDPAYYLHSTKEQGGEYVYYVSPDRKTVIRVADDTVQPNGLIGTPDNKVLYIADPGQKMIFKYTINEDGTLSNKSVFANSDCDGMDIDSQGNIYLTDIYHPERSITVYNPDGKLIETIAVPEGASNCGFGGSDKKTLFITARTSVYSIKIKVPGI